MRADKTLYITPDFKVTDCTLEGHNRLYGPGRIHKSKLGLFSYVQYQSNIANAEIGRFCRIAPFVMIAHGEHSYKFISTHPAFTTDYGTPGLIGTDNHQYHKKVLIGSDVWIGTNAYIKDGVTIGHGAIIGAGSVVTQDVPPYAIVGGVPAKIIRYRFDKSKIEQLLTLKWWDWDLETIIERQEVFKSLLDDEMVEKLSIITAS